MPIDIAIKPMFPVIRGGRQPSAEFEHLIYGATSVAEAHAAYYASLSATYYTGTHILALQTYELKPFIIREENYTQDVWTASATYGLDDFGGGSPVQEPGDPPIIAWDASGGEEHITQALFQRDFPATSGDKNVYKNAIGVTKDSIEGVDAIFPQFSWTEQYTFTAAFADFAYAKNVVAPLTGKTNDASFRTFDEGEVLFMGATATRRGYERIEVTFKFSASPNAAEIYVTPEPDPLDPDADVPIIVYEKQGHEYLWCTYVEKETPADDDLPARMIWEPRSAHVATIYDTGDFSTLGIGTT